MTIAQVPSVILRDPTRFWTDEALRADLPNTGTKLLLVNAGFFAIYGALLGIDGGLIQMVASAGKLPLLFLLTMGICFPALHVLNLIFGGKHRVQELLVLCLLAMTSIATITLGFSPIALFFYMTDGNFSFYLLLNVVMLGIASIFGLRVFYAGMRVLNQAGDEGGAKLRQNVLRWWILVFAFVGCQMAWTMRPFFGGPDEQFAWLRQERGGNFYHSVFRAGSSLVTPLD